MDKEYIERELALRAITYNPLTKPDPNDIIALTLLTAQKRIMKIPAADVAPVVHGEWIEIEREWDFHPYYYVDYTCSICGSREQNKRNYCPECGAKMNGEKRDG